MIRLIVLPLLLIPSLLFGGHGMGPGPGVKTYLGVSGVIDNFGSGCSTTTCTDYTAIAGGIAVSGGTSGGSSTWTKNTVYHNTPLASANQDVSASVTYNGLTDSGGILARVANGTPKTGYMALFVTGKVIINKFTGTALTQVGTYTGSYASGTYNLRLTTNGSTIKVYVDSVERISITDTTYTTGDYCGLVFDRDNENFDARIDTFIGAAL